MDKISFWQVLTEVWKNSEAWNSLWLSLEVIKMYHSTKYDIAAIDTVVRHPSAHGQLAGIF